jgi:AhpD family alkylhydroperoxidase
MRIEPVPADTQRPEFVRARERFGWLPNTVRVMARGSNAAEQYLEAGARNAVGSLSPLARELIAVLVAEANGCEYCRTAHYVAARSLGRETDRVTDEVLGVARRILETRGALSDEELAQARAVGIDDTMLIDIASVIAENTLGNLVNNLAQTEIDPILVRATERVELR